MLPVVVAANSGQHATTSNEITLSWRCILNLKNYSRSLPQAQPATVPTF